MTKSKKAVDVQKFGGNESLGKVKETGNTKKFKSGMSGREFEHENIDWEAESVETQSKTKLEDDEGYGDKVVLRCFEFQVQPIAFATQPPTKQELFNSHLKGIEIALWRDGLKVFDEVEPRIVVDEAAGKYQIFVAALTAKGQLLKEQAKTLAQIAHD